MKEVIGLRKLTSILRSLVIKVMRPQVKLLVVLMVTSIIGLGSISFVKAQKVLVIGIIEENWDNIEMSFEKIKPYSLPKKIYLESVANDLYTKIPETQDEIINLFNNYVDSNCSVFAFHQIRYLMNLDVLDNDEHYNAYIGRSGFLKYYYPIRKLPFVIALEVPIKEKRRFKDEFNKFKYLRLVKNMRIIKTREDGTVKLKYFNRIYTCPNNNKIEFPIVEKYFSITEFEFDNPIRLNLKELRRINPGNEFYRKVRVNNAFFRNKKTNNLQRMIKKSSKSNVNKKENNNEFYIRTKLTVINFGFIEF